MALSKKQQMVVDELRKRVEMCREFMNDWVLFNQIISAYPNSGVNKAQLEKQFLTLKSKLARQHKVLKEALQSDYGVEGNPMNIVAGATSLESIHSQSEVSIKKLQGEWHHAFLSINEMLGVLEDKLRRAENGEKVFIMTAGGPMGGGGGGGGGGGMSSGAKKNLMFIVVVMIIVGIFMFVFKDMYIESLRSLGLPL